VRDARVYFEQARDHMADRQSLDMVPIIVNLVSAKRLF